MVEAIAVGPFRKLFFTQTHESFLKFRDGFSGFRIAGGNDTALAGIVTKDGYFAKLKWFALTGRAEQAVFRKGLLGGEFKIGAKAAADAFKAEVRIPALDCAEAGIADNCGAERFAIVGKTGFGLVAQDDWKTEELSDPGVDAVGVVEGKLGRGGVAVLPKADFAEAGVERASQIMDASRAFAVHVFAIGVRDGIDAVVFEKASGSDARLL